jgi:hypothetical protein
LHESACPNGLGDACCRRQHPTAPAGPNLGWSRWMRSGHIGMVTEPITDKVLPKGMNEVIFWKVR